MASTASDFGRFAAAAGQQLGQAVSDPAKTEYAIKQSQIEQARKADLESAQAALARGQASQFDTREITKPEFHAMTNGAFLKPMFETVYDKGTGYPIGSKPIMRLNPQTGQQEQVVEDRAEGLFQGRSSIPISQKGIEDIVQKSQGGEAAVASAQSQMIAKGIQESGALKRAEIQGKTQTDIAAKHDITQMNIEKEKAFRAKQSAAIQTKEKYQKEFDTSTKDMRAALSSADRALAMIEEAERSGDYKGLQKLISPMIAKTVGDPRVTQLEQTMYANLVSSLGGTLVQKYNELVKGGPSKENVQKYKQFFSTMKAVVGTAVEDEASKSHRRAMDVLGSYGDVGISTDPKSVREFITGGTKSFSSMISVPTPSGGTAKVPAEKYNEYMSWYNKSMSEKKMAENPKTAANK